MAKLTLGLASRALGGGPWCGDQAAAWSDGPRHIVALADGLGHGPDAEAAALAALAFIGEHRDSPLAELLRQCDQAVRATRGAAVGLTAVDLDAGTLLFAGVGNIRAGVFDDGFTRMDSHPGIIGGGFRHVGVDTVAFRVGAVGVLWSDGLSAALTPAGAWADPSELADHLMRRYAHGRDDAGIAVFRHEGDDP